MTDSIEDHAARFDEKADEYDDAKSKEYRRCASHVVEHAAPNEDDVVLDVGTGTGAIALALADDADRVIGRDISEGMLEQAKEKAADSDVSNVEFGSGRFRDPDIDESAVDVVTSNFAMHHLADDEKRDAIDVLAGLGPRRIVLGDIMLFGEPDPSEPFYGPEVDDPATVGVLVDAFTDARYSITEVELIHPQVGVLVAQRTPIDD